VRRFAELYDAIDRTTSTTAKVEAMASYIREAPPEDAAWGIYFLMGRRIRRLLKRDDLAAIAIEMSGIPEWLLNECYSAVGDGAETISLVLDAAGVLTEEPEDVPLSVWVEERIEGLRNADSMGRRETLRAWWGRSDARQVFLVTKLMTGELRVGVSSTLLARAVGLASGVDPDLAAHRLMGDWRPNARFMARVLSPRTTEEDLSKPYPFYLASPVTPPGEGVDEAADIERQLGDVTQYQAEWKWDGIRAQMIRRGAVTVLWSRGEEVVTDRFSEVSEAAVRVPSGTVLDGELLAYRDGKPLEFAKLQTRIGRVGVTANVLAEAPTAFMAYDVMEWEGRDVRGMELVERRALLERIIAGVRSPKIVISEVVTGTVAGGSWAELAAMRKGSRGRGVEGLMLKRKDLPYGVGRERGSWWKWKIDPLSIDAVLIYAQPGHGRRAGLLTDYTFGVWDRGELVPVAKAYSGLTDEEIVRLDTWLRQHTTAKYGPVRTVEATQVFELHFEGIAHSSRHRSGVAFRFPRMARWRTDKKAEEADTIESVRKLLVETGKRPVERTIFDVEE
jgi:DNA ligase-1